jgi:hypothetical protein
MECYEKCRKPVRVQISSLVEPHLRFQTLAR